MILARLGDFVGAEEHLHHALDVHGLDRRRTRAIVLAGLGTVRLRAEDPDAALASRGQFVDLAEGIRSVKVRDALQEMRARLSRLRGVAAAQELDERAADLSEA
jgi:hypothetical protein